MGLGLIPSSGLTVGPGVPRFFIYGNDEMANYIKSIKDKEAPIFRKQNVAKISIIAIGSLIIMKIVASIITGSVGIRADAIPSIIGVRKLSPSRIENHACKRNGMLCVVEPATGDHSWASGAMREEKFGVVRDKTHQRWSPLYKRERTLHWPKNVASILGCVVTM